jgi:integrase
VKAPGRENSRDRVLTDDELRLVWKASESLSVAYGGFVRMLVLTAQRRDEVARMRRLEIKGDVWTIGAERMKGGVAHDVPLSEPAMRIVAEAPMIGEAGYVFTATGNLPVRAYSDLKRATWIRRWLSSRGKRRWTHPTFPAGPSTT